jgi:hypothetical protein
VPGQAAALAHRFCGFSWAEGACTLVPGTACSIVAGGRSSGGLATLGRLGCNFSGVYTAPELVNSSSLTVLQGTGFGAGFQPLDSAVFSMLLPSQAACEQQAAAQQACGWQWLAELREGGASERGGQAARLGSCSAGGPCCILNPYKGCVAGAPQAGSVLGLFGGTGVLG